MRRKYQPHLPPQVREKLKESLQERSERISRIVQAFYRDNMQGATDYEVLSMESAVSTSLSVLRLLGTDENQVHMAIAIRCVLAATVHMMKAHGMTHERAVECIRFVEETFDTVDELIGKSDAESEQQQQH